MESSDREAVAVPVRPWEVLGVRDSEAVGVADTVAPAEAEREWVSDRLFVGEFEGLRGRVDVPLRDSEMLEQVSVAEGLRLPEADGGLGARLQVRVKEELGLPVRVREPAGVQVSDSVIEGVPVREKVRVGTVLLVRLRLQETEGVAEAEAEAVWAGLGLAVEVRVVGGLAVLVDV